MQTGGSYSTAHLTRYCSWQVQQFASGRLSFDAPVHSQPVSVPNEVYCTSLQYLGAAIQGACDKTWERSGTAIFQLP